MARALFLCALLVTSAAFDSSHPALDWMKAHGMDVVAAATECAALPSIIQGYQQECQGTVHGETYAASLLFYAITGIEHMNGSVATVVRESQSIAGVKLWASTSVSQATQDAVATFCKKPQCVDKAQSFTASVASCYSSILCSTVSDALKMPFSMCTDIFKRYVNSAVLATYRPMCAKDENMDEYYCGSFTTDLFLKSVDCAADIVSPHFGGYDKGKVCKPECVKLWTRVKPHVPTCSALMMESNLALYQGIIALMHDLDPELPAPSVSFFDEMCASSNDEVAQKCFDSKDDWADDMGYNCEQYAKLSGGKHCEIYGHEDYGKGTAKDVCCSCGGGKLDNIMI